MKELFHCQASACGVWLEKLALPKGFLLVPRTSPVTTIPSMLHTHSIIYHRHYMVLAMDSVFQNTRFALCTLASKFVSRIACPVLCELLFTSVHYSTIVFIGVLTQACNFSLSKLSEM